MLPNEKFKFEVATKGNSRTIRLRGIIDEDADFSSLAKLPGPLVFNFRELSAINSCGIRSWVNFVKEMGKSPLAFEECPPLVVRQMNMVPSFVGHAKVLSVFVPYVCDNCETEKMVLVNAESFTQGTVNIPEAMPCEACKKGEMELDDHPQQYFAFAK